VTLGETIIRHSANSVHEGNWSAIAWTPPASQFDLILLLETGLARFDSGRREYVNQVFIVLDQFSAFELLP